MTSGTRERKQRRCWECGNVAWHNKQIAPEVCCKKCGSQDTRLVKEPTPTPPPLKSGDAVWVRAVVESVQSSGTDDQYPGYWLIFKAAGDDLLYFGPQSIDKYKPFRRIEGEVKP